MSTLKRIQIKRLKGKSRIDFLFNTGKVIHSKRMFIRMVNNSGDGIYYSGVSVPKKLFKKAVERNRIKRQMRLALVRLDNKKLFEGSGMLIYNSDETPLTRVLVDEVDSLFNSLKKD